MERTVATGVQEKGESRQDRGFQRFSEPVLDPAWNYLPLYFSLDINLLQFPFILTPLWFLSFLWKNFSSKTTKTSFSSTKMFTECALTNYFRKSVFLKNLIIEFGWKISVTSDDGREGRKKLFCIIWISHLGDSPRSTLLFFRKEIDNFLFFNLNS